MVGPPEVKKNRTSMALHSWPLIVGKLHHDVIKLVSPRHCLMGGGIGHGDKAVVVPVAHGFAPAIAGPQRQNPTAWRKKPVVSEENAAKGKTTDWRSAIALALPVDAPGAAQRTGKNQISQPDNAPP